MRNSVAARGVAAYNSKIAGDTKYYCRPHNFQQSSSSTAVQLQTTFSDVTVAKGGLFIGHFSVTW